MTNLDEVSGIVTVVKIGGDLLGGSLDAFWNQIKGSARERSVIVVHGGGAQSTALAREMGREPRMVHGRRITQDEDLRVLQWAVRGELSTSIIASAHRNGVQAIGLSGVDGGLISVRKRPAWIVDGRKIEFGHVGDVHSVNSGLVSSLLGSGFVPVVAPLGVDDSGGVFNVNADTVACEIARELSADELIFLTRAGGVIHNTTLATCDAETIDRGIGEGWIEDGMRLKLMVALAALQSGVSKVRITGFSGLADPNDGTEIVCRHSNLEEVDA